MRSLSRAVGVAGWTYGTYHYSLPKGLPDRTPIVIAHIPDEGTGIIVRDPRGELWFIRHWNIDVGREVQVGSRMFPEWDPTALIHLQMRLLHAIDKHRRQAKAESWTFDSDCRDRVEAIHWQITRNGVWVPPLEWERIPPKCEDGPFFGRCETKAPELYKLIQDGAPITAAPKPRTSGRFR